MCVEARTLLEGGVWGRKLGLLRRPWKNILRPHPSFFVVVSQIHEMSILFSPPWYCACHRLKVIGQVAVGGNPQIMNKDKHISLLSCLFQLFGSEKSDEDPVVIVYVECSHLSGQLLHQTLSTFPSFPLSTFLTSALQLHWPLSISLS